jgi:hypothetical protein
MAWYKYIFVYEFCLNYFIGIQYMTYSSKSDINAKKKLEKLNPKEDMDLYLF